MGYKIYTNKITTPKQNIEFMQKNDYEILEILILNITSNTQLNINKKT
jgi:maleate cis-trans isomerase